MTKTKIDVHGLYAALDAERTARDWSWRQLAKEIGVSPSLLSRLGKIRLSQLSIDIVMHAVCGSQLELSPYVSL